MERSLRFRCSRFRLRHVTRRLRPPPVVVINFGFTLWDDGTELAPGPELSPRQIPLAELAGSAFYDKFMLDFAKIAEQQETESEAASGKQ